MWIIPQLESIKSNSNQWGKFLRCTKENVLNKLGVNCHCPIQERSNKFLRDYQNAKELRNWNNKKQMTVLIIKEDLIWFTNKSNYDKCYTIWKCFKTSFVCQVKVLKKCSALLLQTKFLLNICRKREMERFQEYKF